MSHLSMRSIVSLAVALVATLGLGALLGIVWEALAPRVTLIVASDGLAYPEGFQPEGYATDDGIAAILCVAAGILIGLIAVWITRRALPPERALPVALALVIVLGIVGSLALWWVGEHRGGFDLTEAVRMASQGDVITAPLDLRMSGVLVLWPASSVLVIFLAATGEWLRGRHPAGR
ncbi:MAG: hypothetical protein NWR17_02595 [Candidatus Nanopelagicales bacterium]|nr:hypothetical protein [Candidatus Nanopelagicales bacterium]MDP4906139.1 hypothetical protein [Candidatus Nanopelagicales bacterium]MDP4974109.1 hypothetical protein [Candidatus Nanopelagicales bacterium]